MKQDRETGSTLDNCPGVAGIKALVAYDDQRMSIALLHPGGAEQPLDLWTVVTRGFSSLGRVAEWRVMRQSNATLALIVRVNSAGQGKRSFLAVAKVAAEKSCVVEVIPFSADANRLARLSADQAAKKDCLMAEGSK